MGRAGLEPATLGLKVLHIDSKPNLKKRRFELLDKPFCASFDWCLTSVSFARAANRSRFAIHARHCVGLRARLRKLVPDAELIRRRAANEPLRELAADYNVSHTTLSRFFDRPDVAGKLRQARQERRAGEQALARRRSTERHLEQDVRRKAKAQAAMERDQARAAAEISERVLRRRPRNDYEAWLDERDARVPLTRADLHSGNDQTAARVVAEGGGIQAVIQATDLRTLENVVNLIDPAILMQAYENDAIARVHPPKE
jgi:hypothetical protein